MLLWADAHEQNDESSSMIDFGSDSDSENEIKDAKKNEEWIPQDKGKNKIKRQKKEEIYITSIMYVYI